MRLRQTLGSAGFGRGRAAWVAERDGLRVSVDCVGVYWVRWARLDGEDYELASRLRYRTLYGARMAAGCVKPRRRGRRR